MCLISPSIKGLRKLINICEQYADDHDIIYNARKSKCVHFKASTKLSVIPPINLCGNLLEFVSSFNYLGHVFTDDLKDNRDILKQRRALCGRANFLLRKFSACTISVKLRLLTAFCNNIYGNHLWCDFNVSSMQNIIVCHNNAFRRLIGLPSSASASSMFVFNSVNSLSVLRRKAAFRLRLFDSQNVLINRVITCDVRFCGLQAHWLKILH